MKFQEKEEKTIFIMKNTLKVNTVPLFKTKE